MSEWNRKLKRLRPVVRARQMQLDQEAHVLAELRREMRAKAIKLEDLRQRYVRGVDDTNRVRQSGDYPRLAPLEAGLDGVKSEWLEALRDLREIEMRERAQVGAVTAAQKNLDAAERVVERFVERSRIEESRREQALIDDRARARDQTLASRERGET